MLLWTMATTEAQAERLMPQRARNSVESVDPDHGPLTKRREPQSVDQLFRQCPFVAQCVFSKGEKKPSEGWIFLDQIFYPSI